jgi:hypothetical protein
MLMRYEHSKCNIAIIIFFVNMIQPFGVQTYYLMACHPAFF